jgi:hypothetical protein
MELKLHREERAEYMSCGFHQDVKGMGRLSQQHQLLLGRIIGGGIWRRSKLQAW